MRVVRASDGVFVPAAHEDPTSPGVLKRVIATRDELLSGRVQMINWARLPPESSFRPHYHEDMEETFVMLSGKVQMKVGETAVELGAGDAIVIAPREIHEMSNLGSSSAEYIVLGISLGQDGQTVVV